MHGYKNKFSDAAKHVAQIYTDMRFPGVPAFFSWPSQDQILQYKTDEKNVEWAIPHLRAFIAEFGGNSSVDSIYLVAHSMGNRVALNAIVSMLKESDPKLAKVKELILLAPDVAISDFQKNIQPMLKGKPETTLYASSNDYVISFSQQFNREPRLAQAGEHLTVVKDISTIDASNVRLELKGHSTSQSEQIIGDLTQLFRGVRDPDNRIHLRQKTNGAKMKYWWFPKTEF